MLIIRENLPGNVPQAANVVYMTVAILTTAINTSLCVTRLKTTKEEIGLKRVKVIHVITASVYFLGILFASAAAITNFGFGLIGPTECEAAIVICLTFYCGQKAMLYLFLVERTRVVRNSIARWKDWVYLTGLVIVVIGFGLVAIIAFIYRMHDYDINSSTCHIGLASHVALALLSYDITINIFLTSVFLFYVRPFLTGSFSAVFLPGYPPSPTQPSTGPSSNNMNIPQSALKRVIRKSFWGCALTMPSTIANLTILLVMKGRQQAWMCLTFCTLDVLWGTVVTHWLTSNTETLGSVRSRTTVRWSWMNMRPLQAESCPSSSGKGWSGRREEQGSSSGESKV